MLFRQLFDSTTSTLTYLIADHTKHAVIIDPVFEQLSRDLALIESLELKLDFVLDTHVHADHITASMSLKKNYRCDQCDSKKLRCIWLR